jgi:GTPase
METKRDDFNSVVRPSIRGEMAMSLKKAWATLLDWYEQYEQALTAAESALAEERAKREGVERSCDLLEIDRDSERARAERAEREVATLRSVLDRAHAHSLEVLGLADDGEVARLRADVARLSKEVECLSVMRDFANGTMQSQTEQVQRLEADVAAAVVAATAAAREFIDSVVGHDDLAESVPGEPSR